MMITFDQYSEVIDKLVAARNQLGPDGMCCSVCGDNGHQAWECHHNPLVKNKELRGVLKRWMISSSHCKELHCGHAKCDLVRDSERVL